MIPENSAAHADTILLGNQIGQIRIQINTRIQFVLTDASCASTFYRFMDSRCSY